MKNQMMCSVATFTVFTVFTVQGVYAQDPDSKPTLLFVQQPNNLDFDDQLIEHLESDYEVIAMDSTDPDVVDEAIDADVVYVAESIGSGSIVGGDGTIFQEIETPVIYAEAFAWDDARITGPAIHFDFGNTGRPEALETSEELDVSESLFVVNPDHPMAAGFDGMVEVHTDPFSLNFAAIETLGEGAEVIATADESGEFATTFVYEAGSELEDGTTTPGMRIGLFVSQSSSVPDVPSPIPFDILNENGLALIDAAVAYALGLGGILGDYNGNGAIDAGDLDVQSQYMKDNDPAGDLNGDGKTDVNDRIQWISEIQKSWVGDSNFDGEFSSTDLVAAFTAGKYETNEMASYAEGDWNGDMDFNSSDLVFAFTDGGYELGPREAVAAVVPEPSNLALLALAGSGLLFFRRQPSPVA